MKIRHLYSFSANVYTFPSLHSFIFVRNYSFCNIRQWEKTCFTCNIIPNKRALFSFIKTSNNSATQTTIKQARFYKPCIYDKQLGFNKPAVVIADSLFAVFRHLCINGCLCDMRHIRSKSGFGTNTLQIAGARPKTSTYQKLLFVRSDNAKLFDLKQPE